MTTSIDSLGYNDCADDFDAGTKKGAAARYRSALRSIRHLRDVSQVEKSSGLSFNWQSELTATNFTTLIC
jgi:hypothetical protein